MKIISPVFQHEGKIPRVYSCQGDNISPPLEFSHIPTAANSLVLIMDDPDVPPSVRKDRMYVHWVVYDIKPTTTKIEENATPFGTVGKNTAGSMNYVGPCPPDREHRYFFKLYAIDKILKLPPGATKEEVLKAIEGHMIAQAELMGRYEKS